MIETKSLPSTHNGQHMKLAALLLLSIPLSAARTPLAARVRNLIERSPVGREAYWGFEVIDLDTRTPILRSNQTHFFVPASNTKLFTTALALTRLGAAYQVQTTVTAAATPDAGGQIAGDLTLVGAGDANLSGRPIPYSVDAEKLDPLLALRDLATQLYAKGVRSIAGNVIGDDTRFLYEPYAPGWSIDDPVGDDGAPVSALCVNDNSISLLIEPGRLTFTPPVPPFIIENHIVPGDKRELHIEREPGSSTLRLWGTLPPLDKGKTNALSVDDPARFAAMALIAALKEQGITVSGTAQARHRYPGDEPMLQTGVTLAQRASAPLIEDLRVTDKVSQNLHAEMLLRQVGQGSRRDGLKAMADFLDEAGIEKTQYTFNDGSGLSRLNVVTPHAIVQLLTYMAHSSNAADFASLLPVAGVDGSLRLRFDHNKAKEKVFAKTGSLSHVSALSGYATRKNGHRLAFAILVNNYNGPAQEIRAVIDSICALLVE